MANANDEKIMRLRDDIAKRKEELKKNGVSRFIPKTDCVFPFPSVFSAQPININVCDKSALVILGSFIANIIKYDEELCGMSGFCGKPYSINDYFEDVNNKRLSLEYAERKRQLDAAERKLKNLLSDDKKTELEIDNIMSDLGL